MRARSVSSHMLAVSFAICTPPLRIPLWSPVGSSSHLLAVSFRDLHASSVDSSVGPSGQLLSLACLQSLSGICSPPLWTPLRVPIGISSFLSGRFSVRPDAALAAPTHGTVPSRAAERSLSRAAERTAAAPFAVGCSTLGLRRRRCVDRSRLAEAGHQRRGK